MSAGQLYAQALQAYRATSFETAVELFSEAIALAPKSAKLYDARACAYEKLGRLQEGLHDAREVVKLVPASSKGYIRAAKMLKAATKYANAEKLLLQGLERVAETDEKGQEELHKELEALREFKAKVEHSPFSQLPHEIFLDIIHLATIPPPPSHYTSNELPLPSSKRPRVNTLFSAMRVCRTWYRLIRSTPRLWDTLRLDGVINQRNAERKVCWLMKLAAGVEVKPEFDPKGDNTKRRSAKPPPPSTYGEPGRGKGVRRLVLTAAQDFPAPTYSALLELLASSGASSTVREVVLSFVDGSRTTVSNGSEGARATQLLALLHQHSRETLISLSICTGGRVYPDFDLTSVYVEFPSLRELRVCGSTVSNFVFGLRAPFLRHAPPPASPPSSPSSGSSAVVKASTAAFPPTRAEHLTVSGAVLVSDIVLSRASFPALKTLELDVLDSAVVWDILSVPNLTKYHAVVYGEQSVAELELPDLAAAWARVEDLKIGGAKRLAPRLLDAAVELALPFPFLTSLDLSFAALSSEHLSALFSSTNAPLLQELNLASTTVAVAPPARTLSLPPHLGALRSLNVSHTLWTTDETLRELALCAPRLEKLEIRGNAFITGRPVMELVRGRMPPAPDGAGGKSAKEKRYSLLVDLALEGCTKIETAAVEWLRKNVRPGGLKLQFVDPNERKRGTGSWGLG
ncbi:hypothetical protein JCM10213_007506 [Rhodosporidiobolus nylandii]